MTLQSLKFPAPYLHDLHRKKRSPSNIVIFNLNLSEGWPDNIELMNHVYGKPGAVNDKGRRTDGIHLRGSNANHIYSKNVLQMLKLHAAYKHKIGDGIRNKHVFRLEDAFKKPETNVSEKIIDSKVSFKLILNQH